MKNIVIIGASGAIGRALTKLLSTKYIDATIHAISRSRPNALPSNAMFHQVDYQDETSIEQVANDTSKDMPLDLVLVTNGILHNDEISPEKSLRDLSANQIKQVLQVNTIVPALLAKHFLPQLNKSNRSIFASISARVGSISDNRLGGWYAYRASKAALNMMIKTASIEIGRTNKQAIVVTLHPGTVDSPLSKPFQGNVPEDKLFTPDDAAQKLLSVLKTLKPEQTGKIFAWDGQEIEP